MKKLYVVRHAKSSWDDPFKDDFDRPLNGRGQTDAPRMGKRLRERNVDPDLMISSPAVRALSTCFPLASRLDVSEAKIRQEQALYHASDLEILSVVRAIPDNANKVMIVGHNPGLTDFVNGLSAVPVTGNIPTCGIVAFDLDIRTWRKIEWKDGVVEFYDYPKNKE